MILNKKCLKCNTIFIAKRANARFCCKACSDSFDVNEVTDHFAYGSGMFLALGAMELGATPERAVEVAIKYDLYCGGKVTKIVNSIDETHKNKDKQGFCKTSY